MGQTGETGLALAQQDQPNLILLDVVLPGIDGDALASETPMTYTAGTEKPVSPETTIQFGVQAQMLMAIYPKGGTTNL